MVMSVTAAALQAALMLGGEDAGTGWLVGTCSPDSGPGVHSLLSAACLLQRKACFQGQGSLEVSSLRSRLFGGSCVQGQG